MVTVLLVVLLCYAPAFSEESVEEKKEVVEEYVVLNSSKEELQRYEAITLREENFYNQTHTLDTYIRSAKLSDQKLFILYRSLKLCD